MHPDIADDFSYDFSVLIRRMRDTSQLIRCLMTILPSTLCVCSSDNQSATRKGGL